MIVSDSHQFICFRPWKVASSTLGARLGRYDCGRYPPEPHFNAHLQKDISKHIALRDFAGLPESSEPYYRFTFVRNPYDRIYSGFLQRRWRLLNDDEFLQSDPELAIELENINGGFGQFLSYHKERYARDGKLVGGHLHEYVYHDGTSMVDFVGHVETFEKSFAEVCTAIGVEDAPKINANVRFEDRARIDNDSDWSNAYRYIHEFDADMVRTTNELYARDFELLQYRALDPELFANADGAPADLPLFK